MENKNELLEKLGFTKEYLKLLNQGSSPDVICSEQTNNLIESPIVDNNISTLIIDKTEKPINNHFIYNSIK